MWTKVRVLDPKPFGIEWSTKELENFKWDMEMYFQAVRVPEFRKSLHYKYVSDWGRQVVVAFSFIR